MPATDEELLAEIARGGEAALAELYALAQLPHDQREALELAERLGVSLGTVKSRMFTGLAGLRDLLGEA